MRAGWRAYPEYCAPGSVLDEDFLRDRRWVSVAVVGDRHRLLMEERQRLNACRHRCRTIPHRHPDVATQVLLDLRSRRAKCADADLRSIRLIQGDSSNEQVAT